MNEQHTLSRSYEFLAV